MYTEDAKNLCAYMLVLFVFALFIRTREFACVDIFFTVKVLHVCKLLLYRDEAENVCIYSSCDALLYECVNL